jgi:hypothetical protein
MAGEDVGPSEKNVAGHSLQARMYAYRFQKKNESGTIKYGFEYRNISLSLLNNNTYYQTQRRMKDEVETPAGSNSGSAR